ncbi:Smr/MutS family protein [Novosphingobium sp. SL115]|uniref:Smr/MutS family protein n=1 Tax=Novosphingobium sp. SL115 TaxID=2995150 RepID=UPI0022757B6A|nr:Smr/MutS family protein [Novosphingobium sp. SL115]MCY1670093.1 Smr/MutS family protein [Novosphingobium sp. SL115]
MRAPRGLSAEEAELWNKVAATIVPLHPVVRKPVPIVVAMDHSAPAPAPKRVKGRVPPPPTPAPSPTPIKRPLERDGLDSSWDRKLARGAIAPDVTIDLHGLGLDAAHARLTGGIAQALAMGARVILLIAGKHRPHDEHDLRGSKRGAIRAKLLDWLAHSSHASNIAAVRPAQQRHGGAGAVYIVLRKAR